MDSQVISTFYEDASLHAVGAIRMNEWWQKSDLSQHEGRTGCALTFWASLSGVDDLDRAASITLPDAIKAGLSSLPLAEFEHVYIMTYGQKFDNLPSFMTVLDANRVLKEKVFLRALSSGKACRGFIAVLAEWMKQVAALQLPEVQQYPFVTTFDCDSLWRSRAVPPATCCGHAAGTIQQNKVSRENVNKPKRMQKLYVPVLQAAARLSFHRHPVALAYQVAGAGELRDSHYAHGSRRRHVARRQGVRHHHACGLGHVRRLGASNSVQLP